MDAQELRQRTRQFAIDTIRAVRKFPRTIDGQVVGRQLIRSATSVAANYRAACRSKSPDDFVSKICTVCEEADETQFWFDLTIAASVAYLPELETLFDESTQLVSIFTASRTTAKENQANDAPRGAGANNNESRFTGYFSCFEQSWRRIQ
jgi:four helix bundle protein